MRTVIAVIIALLIGLVAGMGVISSRSESELAELRAARDQAAAAAARLQAELDMKDRRVQTLEAENSSQGGRIEALERQTLQAATSEPMADAQEEVPPMEELPEAAEPDFPIPLPDAPGADEQRDEEDEDNPWRNPEWRAQMRENFRQGVNTFLSDRMTQSQDPAEQQRLAALAEYTDYMFDLRGQMRDAESPEAREALEQEYETAMSEVRRVVDEQQRSMIMNMAESYGITTPQRQEAFVQSVRNLMEDPLLRSTRFMTGFRGGWGRPGDGPGRGMGPGMGPHTPF